MFSSWPEGIRARNSYNDPMTPVTWSKTSPIDLLDGLAEFVAVVEAGSITGAARALGLPRETLGRRLGQLEERLGVRLLHRTTRRLAPSQAGEELYARARRILSEGAAAVEAVRSLDGVPRGRLRVTVPPNDAQQQMSEMLRTFMELYPHVEIEVLATPRHVDLIAEGFDVAVRAGPTLDPTLISRTLVHTELIAVAAPSYLRARGTPRSVDELASHECLRGYDASTSTPLRSWPLRDGGSVEVHGRFATNALPTLIDLAIAGSGIALLPELALRAAVTDGRLVRILPELGTRAQVAIVYPERELLDPKVRAFVDHVVTFFETRVANWDLPHPCEQTHLASQP
jgi:DNA-binding transcriptional LysR family regulator